MGIMEKKMEATIMGYMRFRVKGSGIQVAQCRYYLQTLGPNVCIIYVLGSLGFGLVGV